MSSKCYLQETPGPGLPRTVPARPDGPLILGSRIALNRILPLCSGSSRGDTDAKPAVAGLSASNHNELMKARLVFALTLIGLFVAGTCPAREGITGVGVALAAADHTIKIMKVLPGKIGRAHV